VYTVSLLCWMGFIAINEMPLFFVESFGHCDLIGSTNKRVCLPVA
jgi:hypothetical protein